MTDPIDKAIAATEAEPQTVRLPVLIASTGRTVTLAFPYDLTESELAELCGFMLTGMLGTARAVAKEGAKPIIHIARGLLPT